MFERIEKEDDVMEAVIASYWDTILFEHLEQSIAEPANTKVKCEELHCDYFLNPKRASEESTHGHEHGIDVNKGDNISADCSFGYPAHFLPVKKTCLPQIHAISHPPESYELSKVLIKDKYCINVREKKLGDLDLPPAISDIESYELSKDEESNCSRSEHCPEQLSETADTSNEPKTEIANKDHLSTEYVLEFQNTSCSDFASIKRVPKYLTKPVASSDSLFVNLDSQSLYSLSGEASSDLCTKNSVEGKVESDDTGLGSDEKEKDTEPEAIDLSTDVCLYEVGIHNYSIVERKNSLDYEHFQNSFNENNVLLVHDIQNIDNAVHDSKFSAAHDDYVKENVELKEAVNDILVDESIGQCNEPNANLDLTSNEHKTDVLFTTQNNQLHGTAQEYLQKSGKVNLECYSTAENTVHVTPETVQDQLVHSYDQSTVKSSEKDNNVSAESQIIKEKVNDFSDSCLNIFIKNDDRQSRLLGKPRSSSLIRTFQTQRSESVGSGCESFYSLDNNSFTGSPVAARIKKTLTWTPRVLSENKFASSLSTGTFSDAASFYTAETSGTFYSALSFQHESSENTEQFQTCEDLQAVQDVVEEDKEERSKLFRAKTVLNRGCEFVRSKFKNHFQRLPNFVNRTSLSSGVLSVKFCHRGCGFSCMQPGRDNSLYNITEQCFHQGLGIRGNNLDSGIQEDPIEMTKLAPENKSHAEVMALKQDLQITAGAVRPDNGKPENTSVGLGQEYDQCVNELEPDVDRDAGRRVGPPGVKIRRKLVGNVVKPSVDAHELLQLTENFDDDLMESSDDAFEKDDATREPKQYLKSEDLKSEDHRCGEYDEHNGASLSERAANRMGSLIRETTGDEDDLPVGCEAGSMKKMKDKNDRKSSEKRLQWRSVVEKSVTSSLNSSVEQILCQREMDPETVLRNLGFDGSSADDPLNRIPDRFLAHQRLLQETSLAQYLLSHPELQGQLPVSGSQPFSSPQLMENWAQDQSAAGSSKSKRKGSLHSSFSTVARSIRFIQGAQTQAQAPVSPDEETKVLSAIPSILDLPNRRALARQGFYGPEYVVRRSSETGPDGKSPKGSMSAAERRRQFHYKVKSRNTNWSLTEEPKEHGDHKQQDQGPARESVDSWDRAVLLKSFSDRISSDSSYESNDSVGEERGRLKRENSISNLRRQYQNTIRQSVDRDGSVFTVDEDDVESVLEKSPHRITELRRRQVEGLMLSMVDDGDYCTEDGTVPAFASSRTLAFVNAQNSKMSSLTGSPLTPKEFSYSFEDRLKDGESEFDFEKQPKPAKSCVSRPQNVSIIIEEDTSSLDGVSKREGNPLLQTVSSKNELSFPVLTQRSDSSNTLVPTESMGDNDPESDFASKSGDLDLDPCYADALSESASSLVSGETVIRGLSPFEPAGERTVRFPGSRQSMDDKRLKPLVNPPQESFELEEISSADVAHEDVGGVSRRSSIRRGHMEKTASTQSDSSGFADIDPAGEPTLADHKIRQAIMLNEVPELAETSKLVSVSRKFRNIVEQDYEDNSNPALRTIAYTAETETGNKSVLYTVDLPLIPLPCQQLAKNSLQDQSRQPRYVSSLNLETELLDDDESEKSSESRVRVKPVGPAVFLTLHDLKNNQSHLSDENDFENCDNNLSAGEWRKEGLGIHDVNNETANDSQQTFQREQDVMQSKQSILQRKLSKQSMVASKTQTADWLLNNESKRKAFKMGRPNWASTPNLKPKGDARVTGVWKRHFQMEESMSLDIPLEESGDELSLKLRQHSLDFDHENILGNSKPHLKHLRGDSACASLDESMYSSKSSMLGSYQGVSDEYLNYLRLARLVNGPSPIMDIIPKMPNLKFRPTIHMKNWSKIPKQKMLEEETRLMQHAVQRYKTELAMMENMLFSLYSRVQSDLVPEERADVEELQQLWSQVRKEVIKMEDLLVDRLRAVVAGNASFSPLDSLEIVQTMIDLLREQLYHQQMCIARDVSFSDDEEDEGTGHFPARSLSGASVPSTSGLTGSSVDSAWARELSNQMNELKTSLEITKESQKRELRERISELKTGLLSEVHREVETPTQNKRMLELELQARENEVRRLRMELLLQSVNTGGTRRKQVFESDV